MKAVRSFAYLLLSVVLLITSVTFSAEAQTDTYETMANLVVFVKFPEDNGTDIADNSQPDICLCRRGTAETPCRYIYQFGRP